MEVYVCGGHSGLIRRLGCSPNADFQLSEFFEIPQDGPIVYAIDKFEETRQKKNS